MNHPKTYLYRRVVQAKFFMDEHYSDNIDLADVADEACFSKFHFIRLFRSIYSKTPHRYLVQLRVDKAKQLLKKNVSVSETCFAVGFDSVTTFSGLFKKLTGVTPAVYQKHELRRIADIGSTPLKYIPNCFAETIGWTKNRNFREGVL